MKKQVEELQHAFLAKILNFDFEIIEVTEQRIDILVDGYKFSFLIHASFKTSPYHYESFLNLPELSDLEKQKLYDHFSEFQKEAFLDSKRQQLERLKRELNIE